LKVAWLSYLDPFVFSGGGELANRRVIEAGRERGHEIVVSAWLRHRPQRLLRRIGLHRRLAVDWDADAVVLANLRNHGARADRFPDAVVHRALATGRAVVHADAYVDVCPFDLPCDGDVTRCRADCSRAFADRLYGEAKAATFVSPRQRELIAGVLGVELPPEVLYARPAIDTERFRPLGRERDIDVLYVGTINDAKGYHELVKRFGPDRLTLAGRDALGEPIQGTYLGPQPYDALPELYNRARTFAHLPRWNEPMGRTVVEAALCGCELELNDRVGVRSFPESDWRDPAALEANADRYWQELEAVFT
jgi:glycosyltransferase involved in cell wall biosynthesis